MSFSVGHMTQPVSGDITQLNAIILGDQRKIEANLGFQHGRLMAGYHVLLLKRVPDPQEFEFSGTTLRSGGRDGLPQNNEKAEKARAKVHDSIMAERGDEGYRQLQLSALKTAQINGAKRLVKIVPVHRYRSDINFDVRYPMGGGFLQWTLKKPGLSFLCGASIERDGTVRIPGDKLHLNSGHYLNDLENRTRLQRYLQQA